MVNRQKLIPIFLTLLISTLVTCLGILWLSILGNSVDSPGYDYIYYFRGQSTYEPVIIENKLEKTTKYLKQCDPEPHGIAPSNVQLKIDCPALSIEPVFIRHSTTNNNNITISFADLRREQIIVGKTSPDGFRYAHDRNPMTDTLLEGFYSPQPNNITHPVLIKGFQMTDMTEQNVGKTFPGSSVFLGWVKR